MTQTLKRLELIKTAIDLDDEEIIALQIAKLETLTTNEESQQILTLLKTQSYTQAKEQIEAYLGRCSSAVQYSDPALEEGKKTLAHLEELLQELSQTKNTHLQNIETFNIEYTLRLGQSIQKILKLKKELAEKKLRAKQTEFDEKKEQYSQAKKRQDEIKENIDKLEEELQNIDDFDDAYDETLEKIDALKEALQEQEAEANQARQEAKEAKKALEGDPAHEEKEEAKQDEEAYNKTYEEAIHEEHYELNKAEKKELKALYRKASRLCHPDVVRAELREEAQAIFQELNDAYSINNLDEVKKILHALENGIKFESSSQSIDNLEALQAKITSMQNKVKTLEDELAQIEKDEIFQTISKIDDMDAYFTQEANDLELVYAELLKELEEEEVKKNEDEDFWDIPF